MNKKVDLSEEVLNEYIGYINNSQKMSVKDTYIGVLIITTLFVWILSSWVPAINITVVAIVCFALLFFPAFPVLEWEEFTVANSWNAFFIAGNHITLAAVAIDTGLCDYISGLFFDRITEMPILVLLMVVAAITFIFMAIIPSAPAVATILVPIISAFSIKLGLDPRILFMVCILCIPNIYLFPLDAPLVVAYGRKAFRMFELPKATIWIQLIMIVFVAVIVKLVFSIIY